MKYRKLKSLNSEISEISLGTFPFKGWWGEPLSDQVVVNIIQKAIELGVNYIDTADVYGLGETELLVGKLPEAIKSRLLIATKGGRDFTTSPGKISKNFAIPYLKRALDNSLERLKTKCVPVYFLHGPETQDIISGDIFNFLEEAKSKRLIKASGVSVNTQEELELILTKYDPDIVSLPYNFLSGLNIEAILDTIKEKNIDLIIREPLAQGLLTGKYGPNAVFPETDHRNFKWTKEFWDKNSSKLEEFNTQFTSREAKIKGAFDAILKHQSIKSVIFGVKSVEQLIENIEIVEK